MASDAHDIVIMGATGDLGRRKILPALYRLFEHGDLPAEGWIIGYGRRSLEQEAFRELVSDAVREHAAGPVDDRSWERFCARLRYVAGGDGAGPDALRPYLAAPERLIYLAIPPRSFASMVRDLGELGLGPGTRLVVEKPFGHDLASSRELDGLLHRYFDEEQVYRIDHYMGKETVQNILVVRFGNAIFERLWNRDVIDHMQITVAEPEGVDGRGAFYDETGALRDIIQNHVLQVFALLTMEPPASLDAGSIYEEKQKLLRSVHPVDPGSTVIGQYVAGTVDGGEVPGYRADADVDAASRTETFAALRLAVDNWRWAGVPFYLRSGKRLPRKVTEVHVQFRDAPVMPFQASTADPLEANHLTLRIQPDEAIELSVLGKQPGPDFRVREVRMNFSYADAADAALPDGYERLLLDALEGDRTLFIHGDTIERAWEILQPVLDQMPPLRDYPAGVWGPAEADALIAPRQWHLH